jgi:hypothetical protein
MTGVMGASVIIYSVVSVRPVAAGGGRPADPAGRSHQGAPMDLDVRRNPALLKLDLYCKGMRIDDSCLV